MPTTTKLPTRQTSVNVTPLPQPTTTKQGRRDLNPQPLVLETSALPIELHPSKPTTCSPITTIQIAGPQTAGKRQALPNTCRFQLSSSNGGRKINRDRPLNYSTTLVTTPEPTVRPPSRIAKRLPSSIAIGLCNSTVNLTLSPGMHISASIRFAVPVTSVVRK